jgi:hypothetical protein
MEDRLNDLLDKLVIVRLEEVMDLLEDDDSEGNDELYDAAKKMYVYFGGELDDY